MSFLQLNGIFLAVSLVVFVLGVMRSRNRSRLFVATALTLAVLLVLTAVFDNVMIGAGLFDYGGHTLAGPRVGLAPVEDFAYPLAATLLLPGLWMLFSSGRKS